MSAKSSALIVIDVQQSFLHRPFWDDAELPAFRQNLLNLIDGCRARGVPVLHVFHEAPGRGGPFDPVSGYVQPLDWLPGEPDAVFRKQAHSALVGTGLEAWLRAHQIERLLISGIRTEQCCETTTRHASDIGFEVDFVSRATLSFAMTHASGRLFSAEEIRIRTELVLAGRFARIASVEQALAALPPVVPNGKLAA